MAAVRLRPLTEAECYARCYGGRRDERVSFVGSCRGAAERDSAAARAACAGAFEERLDVRGPEAEAA